jgi:hypothetical protein
MTLDYDIDQRGMADVVDCHTGETVARCVDRWTAFQFMALLEGSAKANLTKIHQPEHTV